MAFQSTCDNYTRTVINIPRPRRHTHPVNLRLIKPVYRSSSLCNRCVHIFDRLQLRLRHDHTATPTICTKHRDHPDLLDALSPRTYTQLSLRLSTAPNFNTCWDDTDILQQKRFYTHAHLSWTIRSIKTWHLKLTHLSLSVISFTIVCEIDVFIGPATVLNINDIGDLVCQRIRYSVYFYCLYPITVVIFAYKFDIH